MTASARFAHTDYPAEVEDFISDAEASPTIAAVAGYAILASNTPRALVFAIAAGSGLDAVTLPLQPLPSATPPALSLWQAGEQLVGAAILSSDGVLRVFRSVDLRNPSLRCEEIRVAAALSTDRQVAALRVIHVPSQDALYVFGAQGTAAIVSLRDQRLSVRSLGAEQPGDRSSRIGSMFVSAFRSIGVEVRRDEHWALGSGPYAIVGIGVVNGGVVLARSCGDVERWGRDGLLWTFSVFDIVGGRDSRKTVISAGVTSDGTIALLADGQAVDAGRNLACFDVRDDVPTDPELVMPLDECLGEDVFMVVSGDIAYLYMQRSRTLAWMSVARGVPSEGQVLGSTTLETDYHMFGVVDASFGLPEASDTGGVAACLHAEGVWLASSAVPAPVSLDVEDAAEGPSSVLDSVPLLWRAFLQYRAGQTGAAKASLKGLVNSLVNDGFNLEEALSEVVQRVSRKIITSDQDPDKDPMALLIDTELEKKQRLHASYIKLLSDGDLFAQVRPNAPSIAEDRLWDAIKLSSRSSVVTDGEKLAAASKVRDIENMQPGYIQRFNDAASTSFIGTNPVRSSMRSIPAMSDVDEQESVDEGPSVIKTALMLAGKSLPIKQGSSDDEVATGLYRYPFEFQRFLPALEKSMKEAISRLQSDENMGDGSQAIEGPSFRRAARNVVLLTCEAAIAVAHGSQEARDENGEQLSQGPHGMNGVGNWLCDYSTCRKVLFMIAETSLHVAKRSSEAERKPMMRAAFLVVDELLACASLEAAARGVLPRETGSNTPMKRRRLDLRHETSEWEKELRSSLDMLRKSGLDEDAFQLAEKYGDFGTMLSLQVLSAEFDEFMENSLQRFGDDFGLFAFQWLEERNKIHLLLRGRSQDRAEGRTVALGRSERVSVLLSEYFRTDRRKVSNLSWMHWLSIGEFNSGAKGLVRQIRKVSEPGKAGSTQNARLLGSIAKLALLASRTEDGLLSKAKTADLDYVSAQLHMTELQERVEPKQDALVPGAPIIRKLVNDGPSETDKLAEQVVAAIDAVHMCDSLRDEASNMEDFVWRRCVERQSDLWLPMVQSIATSSDIQLREKLMGTALYKAAEAVSLSEREMADIIHRGTFEASEFAARGCVPEVTRLVKTAVALTAA